MPIHKQILSNKCQLLMSNKNYPIRVRSRWSERVCARRKRPALFLARGRKMAGAKACLGSVLGNAWGVWTYERRGKDKKLIAQLQVKQELKK